MITKTRTYYVENELGQEFEARTTTPAHAARMARREIGGAHFRVDRQPDERRTGARFYWATVPEGGVALEIVRSRASTFYHWKRENGWGRPVGAQEA